MKSTLERAANGLRAPAELPARAINRCAFQTFHGNSVRSRLHEPVGVPELALLMLSGKAMTTKRQANRTREESKRSRKLMRLDDLIPKKDVTGGRQVLFGARDSNGKKEDMGPRTR